MADMTTVRASLKLKISGQKQQCTTIGGSCTYRMTLRLVKPGESL